MPPPPICCASQPHRTSSSPISPHRGYGYPALVAVNPAKGKFSSLRSAFEAANVLEFINSVRTGQERVEPVTGALAALTTTDPWDGKEGVLEVEEEFSLEDLMGKEEL